MTLTTSEAAARLGVDETTVRRWVMRGWLRPVLGSRPARFREADVERAYAERQAQDWHDRLDTLAAHWQAGT